MPPLQQEDKQKDANLAVNILQEISEILVSTPSALALSSSKRVLTHRQNCHLDRRELSICISLIERGVNPEALAVSYPSGLLPVVCRV